MRLFRRTLVIGTERQKSLNYKDVLKAKRGGGRGGGGEVFKLVPTNNKVGQDTKINQG